MKHNNNPKPSAFSLIELSIVLIIIGLLAGGIVAGSVLVKRARIEAAKSLTNKSPIKATEDLVMWFEGSLSDSFANGQSVDNTSISSGWNNIGGGNEVASATVDGNAPIYANSINSIPAVKFEGSNALKVSSGAINNSDYTIMIAEQRESDKVDNYIIGDPSITGTNQNLLVGYKTDGTIIHSQGGSNSYTSAISSYAAYSGARIIIITHSASEGNKTYINGVLAGQLNSSVAKDNIADLSNLSIGKNYKGQIGELAVFKRALSNTEITDISDYMSNKWRIKVDAKNTDCSTGIVTESGCDASSCPVSIAGISKTSVNGTTGTATLSCDKTGYSGSITYSCINKTFATTPANATCSCATGYALSNGFCIPSCNVPTTNGITTTQVTGNNGIITCDATGYTGSVAYSCASQGSNATITGSCSCATDYYLSNGSCVTSKCSSPTALTGVSAYTTTGLISTNITGTATCGNTGYTGSLYYKCNNTVIEYYSDNSYATKLTNTPTCSCATGYSLVNGVCTAITCTTPAGNGYNAQTSLPYTGANASTFSCASGVNSGNVTYRCQSAGSATIVTNTCAVITSANNGTCSCNNYCAKNWNSEVSTNYPSASSAVCIGAKISSNNADIGCGGISGVSQKCYCQPSTSGSWVPYGSSCQ